MDEEALVGQAMDGDREAFAELVRLHQGRLRGMAALCVVGRDDVHDIVQEAFIDAWRGLPRFEAGRPFGPWLRTICRNRIRRFLRDRRAQRSRELAAVDEALALEPEDDPGAERRIAALRTCLAGLEAGHRDVILRRYRDDAAVQDIADDLGRTPNAVSMLILRIKSALQRCLGQRLAGEPG